MTSFAILVMLLAGEVGPDPCALTVDGDFVARDECLRSELKLFGDPSRAPEAVRTVASIGTAAVASLLIAVKDSRELVRANAVDALGRIAAKELKGDVIPALITALKDGSQVVRRQAAGALGRIGPRAAEALPALTVAEGDPDATVRGLASAAVRRINKPAAVGQKP